MRLKRQAQCFILDGNWRRGVRDLRQASAIWLLALCCGGCNVFVQPQDVRDADAFARKTIEELYHRDFAGIRARLRPDIAASLNVSTELENMYRALPAGTPDTVALNEGRIEEVNGQTTTKLHYTISRGSEASRVDIWISQTGETPHVSTLRVVPITEDRRRSRTPDMRLLNREMSPR